MNKRKWDKYVVKREDIEPSKGSKSPGAFLDDIDAWAQGPTSDLIASRKNIYYKHGGWLKEINEFKEETKIESIYLDATEMVISLEGGTNYSCGWEGKFETNEMGEWEEIEFDAFILALKLPKQHWKQLIRAIYSEVQDGHDGWFNPRYKESN